MNYFLDTCVGLGYVFCTNPWNDKSEHLFNKEATFYISYCVGKELNKKYNDILKGCPPKLDFGRFCYFF